MLVASDAIGMGLNLAIKRIIFSQVEKFDGRSNRELTPAVSTAASFYSIIGATPFYSVVNIKCTVHSFICLTIYIPLQEIKQIAGRAGRYGTQYADGVVTCMSPEDLKCVRKGMQIADQPVLRAGILII